MTTKSYENLTIVINEWNTARADNSPEALSIFADKYGSKLLTLASRSRDLCRHTTEYWKKYKTEMWVLPTGIEPTENVHITRVRESLEEL